MNSPIVPAAVSAIENVMIASNDLLFIVIVKSAMIILLFIGK